MFEWQTTEEHETLPPDHDTAARQRPPRRRLAAFAGIFLLLALAAGGVLYWRLQERTDAMRTDLDEFVRYEEQQRQFGLADDIDSIVVENASPAWKQDYRSTFQRLNEAGPITVTVESVEFDGTMASMIVQTGEHEQARMYRLTDAGWRRAPGDDFDWGGERTAKLTDDIILRFHERDADFARSLVESVPELLTRWPIRTTVEEIIIAPDEFGPPLIRANAEQIYLNSPLLTLSRPRANGADTVRLALAHALLQPANVMTPPALTELPGALRFRAAIRSVVAARWALAPETYREMRSAWRTNIVEQWRSPFFSTVDEEQRDITVESLWNSRPSISAALLVADYVYTQRGAAGLAQVRRRLAGADSWDSVFLDTLGQYTVEVEANVQDETDSTEVSAVDRYDQPAALRLPLDVTVSTVVRNTRAITVTVAGSDLPLRVQTDGATDIRVAGSDLTLPCTALYRTITIEAGDWLTLGEHLLARRITVANPEPAVRLDVSSAPTDTLAYLRLFPVGDSSRLVALRDDGTTWPVLSPPDGVSVVWNPQGADIDDMRLLFRYRPQECNQTWLYLYDPRDGIIDQWLTSPDVGSGQALTVRNRTTDEVLFFGSADTSIEMNNTWHYASLRQRASGQRTHTGTLERSWFPYGWRNASGQLIVVDHAGPPNDGVMLVDVTTGNIDERYSIPIDRFTGATLSRDETRLLYRSVDAGGIPNIRMLNLDTGEDTVFIRGSREMNLTPLFGKQPADAVLLYQRSIESEQRKILMVPLTEPDNVQTLVQIGAEENVDYAVPCAGDRLLYTIEREDVFLTDVRLRDPDGTTRTLFSTDGRAAILACR